MGHTAISLWEEAVPLERNRTGCDGGTGGFGVREGGGGVGGLDQVRHNNPLSYFVRQLGPHCCKPH